MTILLTGFLIGCAFGAILYLGGATSYRRILGTLRLKDMWIIKLMGTAIGVGALGIALLNLGGWAHMSVKPVYVWGVALGGLVFGVGWAVSGFCPGTCVVGAAEGKKDALATLLGGLVGALIFSLVHPSLEVLIKTANFGELTLNGLLGINGIWPALVIFVAFIGITFFVLKDNYE